MLIEGGCPGAGGGCAARGAGCTARECGTNECQRGVVCIRMSDLLHMQISYFQESCGIFLGQREIYRSWGIFQLYVVPT